MLLKAYLRPLNALQNKNAHFQAARTEMSDFLFHVSDLLIVTTRYSGIRAFSLEHSTPLVINLGQAYHRRHVKTSYVNQIETQEPLEP
jgi:hypothetical protein